MSEQKQSTSLIGWLFIATLSFMPVVLWVSIPDQISAFSLLGIGKILGLFGTALFSISFFLSTRLSILEKIFGGFNKIYDAHSKIGQAALIVLLFHPIFLLQNNSISASSAIRFFIPSENWAINWGIFSLFGMLILIIITLYLRPKYNLWKFTHKFLGFAFFLAALHIYLIPSDTSQNIPLRLYMLGIVGLGLLSFSYKTLLGSFFIKQFECVVSEVHVLSERIVEIILTPVAGTLSYTPGQFGFLSFKNSQMSSESHPFSFTSTNDKQYISVLIKKLGDYTEKINEIPIGSQAWIEGPYGNFSFKTSRYKNQVWIAGGIGITPFMSMARSLKPTDHYTIDLYYCVRNPEEAVKIPELQALSQNLQGIFRFILYCSSQSGHISPQYISKNSGGLEQKSFFLCAPVPMIHAMRYGLQKAGVS